jgi:hypothetical protein
MVLLLFLVITVGRALWNDISKGISHHTPKKFQDRFCHINAIPTRKPETGTFVIRAQIVFFFFFKTIKLLTCCIYKRYTQLRNTRSMKELSAFKRIY